MESGQTEDPLHRSRFRVVVIAYNGFRLPKEEVLEQEFPDGLNYKCYTKYYEEGFESPVPRETVFDAMCWAPNRQEAQNRVINEAGSANNVLSFLANGIADEPTLALVYDATPQRRHRELIQHWHERPDRLPWISPRVSPLHYREVIYQLDRSEHHRRIGLAMYHYTSALANWRTSPTALNNLYIAAEHQIKAWSRKKADDNKNPVCAKYVFHNDTELEHCVRNLSDMYEHGYGAKKNPIRVPSKYKHIKLLTQYNDIRKYSALIDNIKNETAQHVRQSILEILDVIPTTQQEINNNSLQNPVASGDALFVKMESLVTDNDDTMTTWDNSYPYFVCQPVVREFKDGPRYHIGIESAIGRRRFDSVSTKETHVRSLILTPQMLPNIESCENGK